MCFGWLAYPFLGSGYNGTWWVQFVAFCLGRLIGGVGTVALSQAEVVHRA